MSMAPYGGGGAAAAAAIADAIKASGVLVRVKPQEFSNILARQEAPLVVAAPGGFLTTNYQYLTSYKGLAFFTKSPQPLELTLDTEVVTAKRIYIPG